MSRNRWGNGATPPPVEPVDGQLELEVDDGMRCVHGRRRLDPCLGCSRRYVDGELVGLFVEAFEASR